MGFLLGEIVEYIVKKFTDSDNQVDIKRHISKYNDHVSLFLYITNDTMRSFFEFTIGMIVKFESSVYYDT